MRFVYAILEHWLEAGIFMWLCRRCIADIGKEVHYALDEDELNSILSACSRKETSRKSHTERFR